MLDLYVIEGKRIRTSALTDTEPQGDFSTVRMSDEEFLDYQHAKAKYEAWQRRLAHRRRYGW